LKSSKRNTNNRFRFSEIIFRSVIIIEERGYSKLKSKKKVKEIKINERETKKEKKLKKKKGKKESSEKILVIFFVFWNEFSFSNYYLKNLFEKKK